MFNWLIKPSTRAWFREWRAQPDHSFADFVHGYVYARWPYFYIGVAKGQHPLTKVVLPVLRLYTRLSSSGANGAQPASRQEMIAQRQAKAKKFADSYHGKVVPMDTAKKLLKVDREIPLHDLEQVVPYETAREIVLSKPEAVGVIECPCRSVADNHCGPLDTCLIIGEPFVSFMVEHHGSKARRITPEEGVRIVEDAHARGNVQHAFFKDAMLGRFYAVCNCCSCCCGAMRAYRAGVPMLCSSGYVARVDAESCKSCGLCAQSCQFKAIATPKDKPIRIREKRCLGCGVCVDKCPADALALVLAPERGMPLDV